MDKFVDAIKNKFPNIRIAVIGDVMLDQYYSGEVEKISPEAPVPVNRIKNIASVLGGAANVAANIAGLGCHSYILGVAGDDTNFITLENIMKKNGIDGAGIIKRSGYSTITKLRILGAHQQMMRLDFEEIVPITEKEENQFLSKIQELIEDGLNGIIISDYAKGVCTESLCEKIITLAKKKCVKILVDPKGSNWTKYNGADFITPNLKELCEITSQRIPNEDSKVVELIKKVDNKYNFENIVVTRAEKGMTLFNSSNKELVNSKAVTREVYDVSGAGDTVAATLLAGVLSDMDFETATYFSNVAAGIVVGKVGTIAIDANRLIKEFIVNKDNLIEDNKVVSREEISALVERWKINNEKIVFTNGCFDILHSGHVTYLRKAAQLGSHLIVGLNSDSSVKRLKGETRPINKELERALLLSGLECVDKVVIFEEDTPRELLQQIKPDILVKGGDYEINQIVGREYAKEVRLIDFEAGYSTTNIIDTIKNLVKEGRI